MVVERDNQFAALQQLLGLLRVREFDERRRLVVEHVYAHAARAPLIDNARFSEGPGNDPRMETRSGESQAEENPAQTHVLILFEALFACQWHVSLSLFEE